MTQNEFTALQGIAAVDQASMNALDALRTQDFVGLSVAVDSLIAQGLVVEDREFGEYFPTADGVRAVYA